jgi:hypothetical protein
MGVSGKFIDIFKVFDILMLLSCCIACTLQLFDIPEGIMIDVKIYEADFLFYVLRSRSVTWERLVTGQVSRGAFPHFLAWAMQMKPQQAQHVFGSENKTLQYRFLEEVYRFAYCPHFVEVVAWYRQNTRLNENKGGHTKAYRAYHKISHIMPEEVFEIYYAPRAGDYLKEHYDGGYKSLRQHTGPDLPENGIAFNFEALLLKATVIPDYRRMITQPWCPAYDWAAVLRTAEAAAMQRFDYVRFVDSLRTGNHRLVGYNHLCGAIFTCITELCGDAGFEGNKPKKIAFIAAKLLGLADGQSLLRATISVLNSRGAVEQFPPNFPPAQQQAVKDLCNELQIMERIADMVQSNTTYQRIYVHIHPTNLGSAPPAVQKVYGTQA